MRRLIIERQTSRTRQRAQPGPGRQHGGGDNGSARLDKKTERRTCFEPGHWERHVRAPSVECRRRSDRRQGVEGAGYQRCRQRKGEGPSGRRRVVRVGCGAAAVRLRLRDNSLGACARFSRSVHLCRHCPSSRPCAPQATPASPRTRPIQRQRRRGRRRAPPSA